MKNHFVIFTILIISISCHAQTMMIGARAGINLANEKYDNLPDGETISSRGLFLGGAQVDYRFTNSLEISLQVLYDQKGAHAEIHPTSAPTAYFISSADWIASYIEVPILMKVCFGDGYVHPYLFVGPSIGFLLHNSERVRGGGIADGPPAPSIDTTANITDSTAKLDFSLFAGAGVSITLPSGLQLFLDAGYAFGLVNIDKYYNDNKNDYYIHSRDIRIAAGILFTIF